MAGDTIPEHDWTGRHQTRVEELVEARASTAWRKTLAAIVIAVVITGIGGVGSTWLTMQTDAAARAERDRQTEQRLDAIESRVGDVSALQRDVASLTAKVDAWRSADVAARAAERADLERRLTRLEQLLDRRR